MTDHSKIDDQFRNRQHDWDGAPSDAAWDRLSSRLDAHRRTSGSGRWRIIRWSAAACIVLLFSISMYMFNQSFQATGFHAQKTDLELEPPVVKTGSPDLEALESGELNSSQQTETYRENAAVSNTGISNAEAKTKQPTVARQYDQNPKSAIAARQEAVSEKVDQEVRISKDAEPVGNPENDVTLSLVNPAYANPYEESAAGQRADTGGDFDMVEEAMPDLADAAVSNAAGIEAQKLEHEQDAHQKRAKQEEKAMTGSSGKAQANEMTAMEFTESSLIIYIPTEREDGCHYFAIKAISNDYFVDPCHSGGDEFTTLEPISLKSAPILNELLNKQPSVLHAAETEVENGPCLSTGKDIRLIYRTGTTLSYNDQEVRLPLREFCLPEYARDWVRALKALQLEY